MKKLAVILFLAFSVLKANASSQWMWHGAFPWVYSHAESSWWYMKAGTDGKFLAWKQGDKKWYSFDEAGKAWTALPGQADVQDDVQDSPENKAGDTFTIPDLSLEMIWVEPGTFSSVTLTSGFWLGKYEVTQAQYEAVMTGNANGLSATPSNWPNNPNRPVEMVSWEDVQVFLTRLNAAEQAAGRLPAGMQVQLPTEAQWEYACRAGTTWYHALEAFSSSVSAVQANVYDGGFGGTTDVGKYPANAWGFHDMHGNVAEWCADWYGDYPIGAVSDPVGPAVGSRRVNRGGSFATNGIIARSGHRNSTEPVVRMYTKGFRLSLRPPANKPVAE